MGNKKYIKVKLLEWWQWLIIGVVIITVVRVDPLIVFEGIMDLAKMGLQYFNTTP